MLRGMWLAVPALVAACSFQHGALSGDAQGGGDDDSGTNIDIDAPLADVAVDTPAGDTCVGSSGSQLVVCYHPGNEPMNAYNPANTIDTSNSNNCDQVINQDFPDPSLCIKQGSSITITGNIRITGSRPFVLVSMSTIMVSGSIDVSNGGAGSGNLYCSFNTNGSGDNSTSSGSGGGGGGGGGWGASGGNGGFGSVNGGSGGFSISLNSIRGGCPGGNGGGSNVANGAGGGSAGGAVYLIAKTSISVPGSITANGQHGRGGGHKAGGGGGGSGGFIAFDAPVVTVDGTVMANGGGGGEGGDSDENGDDGQDPVLGSYNQRAPGGTNGANNGGSGGGGSGGTSQTLSGLGGSAGNNAGGGGGGGAGRIRRYGGMGLPGKISPPAP